MIYFLIAFFLFMLVNLSVTIGLMLWERYGPYSIREWIKEWIEKLGY